MIRTNRSKIVSTFFCPRYRYLKYYLGGKGIQRVSEGLPSLGGKAFHEVMKDIALGDSVETALSRQTHLFEETLKAQSEHHPFYSTMLSEQTYLLEAAVRAVVRVRLPEIEADFELLQAETELQWEVEPGFVIDLRFDRLEKEKATGNVIVRDWKMTGRGGFEWVRKFERDPQVFCYVAGAKDLFPNYEIAGMAIEGIIRGSKKASKLFPGFKEQQTPLCYGYLHDSGKISPKYQQGNAWQRIPLWEHLPAQEWIEEALTKEEVREMFISSVPPICPTDQRLLEWRLQTVPSERRLAAAVERESKMTPQGRVIWLAATFPKNSENCYKYGSDYPCEMMEACWNGEVESDPIGSGLYEERVSHHADEEE